MRLSLAALTFALCFAAPARAAMDEEEQQRCVWSCLAHSKGNTDPAYERCVKKLCSEEDSGAAHKKK